MAIDIAGFEAAEFADPQAAGVNGFEDGDVAAAAAICHRPDFVPGLGRRQQLCWRCKQGLHLLFGQKLGESFVQFRQGKIFDRRCG